MFGGFFLIDLAYFAANALKIPSGGWLPLAVAAGFAYHGGHLAPRPPRAVGQALRPRPRRRELHRPNSTRQLIRVPGTAVFMTGNPDVVPTALLHNIEHNQVLHQQVVLMTVRTRDMPVRRGRRSGSRSRSWARASTGSW